MGYRFTSTTLLVACSGLKTLLLLRTAISEDKERFFRNLTALLAPAVVLWLATVCLLLSADWHFPLPSLLPDIYNIRVVEKPETSLQKPRVANLGIANNAAQ